MKIPVVGLRHEYDTNVQAAVPREEVFLEHSGFRGGFGFPTEPHPSQFYVVAEVKYDKSQGYVYTLINKATKKISQTNMIYRESDMTRTNGYELGFCKMESEYIDLMPKDKLRLLYARANALATMNVSDPELGAYRDLPAGYKGARYIPHGRKFTTADLLDKIGTYCEKQYPDYDISVKMDGEEYVGKMDITILSGPQELRSQESVLRGYVRTRGVEPNDRNKSLLTPQGYNMLIDITQYAMSYNARYEHEDYPNYYLNVNIGSWQNEYIINPNLKQIQPSFNNHLNRLTAEQVSELHQLTLSQITKSEADRSKWEMLFLRDPINTEMPDLAKFQYNNMMDVFSQEMKSLERKLESIEREMEHRQFTSAVETFNECYREGTRLEGECDRLQVIFEEARNTNSEHLTRIESSSMSLMVDPLLSNRADQLPLRRTMLEEAIREEMHYLSDGNATPDKELLDKWADRLNIESRMPIKSCLPTIERIGIGQALADAANNFSQTDCLRTLTHEPANSSALHNARRKVLAESIREEIRFQQADFDRQKGEFWDGLENQYSAEIQCRIQCNWSAFKEKYNQEYKKWNEVLTEVEKQIKNSTKSKVKNGPSRLLQSIEHKINEKTATNANKTIDIQNPKTI